MLEKLEERLKFWNEGNIEEIIQEAKTIQNRFCYSTKSRHTREDSGCSFAKLMLEGKVSGVLKMLSKDFDNGVVKLDKKSSWETLLNNEIVSEQILAINRNNSNQWSEKVNRIESKLLPDIKRAVMQIKEKVHIAGSRLYLYKNMAVRYSYKIWIQRWSQAWYKSTSGMETRAKCFPRYSFNKCKH